MPMNHFLSLGPSNIRFSTKNGCTSFLGYPGTRCFVKADTLPEEMAAKLTTLHGKTRVRIYKPGLKLFAEAVEH